MADEVAVVAQSDVTETTQVTPEETQAAETPEGGEQTDEQAQQTKDNPEHPEDKNKRKGGWQRKIERLEREKVELLQRESYWRNNALGAKNPQTQQSNAAEPTQKPKMDDFETADAYFEALADWKAEEKLRTFQQRQADEAKARSQQSEQEKQFEAWSKAQVEFSADKDDYADATEDSYHVLMSSQSPAAQAIAQVVTTAANGPELMYVLGKNLDELSRIVALPPAVALIEMGKLTATGVAKPTPAKESVTTPPPPPQTRAPAPPTPVTKPGPVGKPKPDDPASDKAMSDEEWWKAREAQRRQGRK
jgi:hypothetical protein